MKKKITKKVVKKSTKSKLALVAPVPEPIDMPMLAFTNKIGELVGVNGNHEYCSSLYAAMQRFRIQIEGLNKKYNVNVKDTIYFELIT